MPEEATKLIGDEIEMLQSLADEVVAFFVKYSFQLVGAVIILIIGWLLSRWVAKFFLRFCEKKKVDVTLANFLASFFKILVLGIFMVVALQKFGFEIAPLLALAGASAFGITLALQGPVSNYGAGLAIILGRPFKVGHGILMQGHFGIVKEVKLATTTLETEDGEAVVIPNKHIVGEVLLNTHTTRVIEVDVGVAYSSDLEAALGAIAEVLRQNPRVEAEHAPMVGIKSFGDSAIILEYRAWVPADQYYPSRYEINRQVFDALGKAGVAIPFPQREVRLLQGGQG